jgi:hypothetical protein
MFLFQNVSWDEREVTPFLFHGSVSKKNWDKKMKE